MCYACAMAVREFECASCGTTVRSRYKVQKVCEICAIIRQHNWGVRDRDCEDCGNHYWPIKTSYVRCADCHLDTTGRKKWPTCDLCGRARRTPPGLDKPCLGCVEDSELNRKRYLMNLRQIILARRG